MAPKKKLAPIGWNPIDASTAYGIQSKAVSKYTNFIGFIAKYLKPFLDFFEGVNYRSFKLDLV